MAKNKLEKLAQEILSEMQKEGEEITLEEAMEMAKMEQGAKEIKRYEQSNAPRKKIQKERKIDFHKKELFTLLKNSLADSVEFTSENYETEFGFRYKNANYSVKIIRHREPK